MTKLGRPRKYLTEEDRLEAKRRRNRIYQRSIKSERRKRYALDSDYRNRIVQRARESYRKRVDFEPKGFGLMSGQASRVSVPVKISDNSKVSSVKGLRVKEMSKVMGVVPKVLYGWIATKKFPAPKLKDIKGKGYYSVKQANALAKVLKDGLDGRGAFRTTDTDVIEKLHSVFNKKSIK